MEYNVTFSDSNLDWMLFLIHDKIKDNLYKEEKRHHELFHNINKLLEKFYKLNTSFFKSSDYTDEIIVCKKLEIGKRENYSDLSFDIQNKLLKSYKPPSWIESYSKEEIHFNDTFLWENLLKSLKYKNSKLTLSVIQKDYKMLIDIPYDKITEHKYYKFKNLF